MKLLVCLGNVPDTTSKIKFNNGSILDKTGVQWIINPWDELALTRALELKENQNCSIHTVTVVTVGKKDAEPTIRKALAIGADDAIRIDAEPQDAYYVAAQLAEIVKEKDYDLILCGIDSCDYNSSAVGGMLSEFLELPSVSSVSGIDINGEKVELTRDIDGGKEVVVVKTPLVAIVQKGIAKEARIAAMRGIIMTRNKPLAVIEPTAVETLTCYSGFELPQAKAPCKMVDSENIAELVNLLRNEAKVF